MKIYRLIAVAVLLSVPFSCNDESENTPIINPPVITKDDKIETFSFLSNGNTIKGKIYLPASFEKGKNLPTIYLIDFAEQHFTVATDEFDKLIESVLKMRVEALVVTLDEHLDVSIGPSSFQEYYNIFKEMTLHVDGNYSKNISRTFTGRGSEGGLVLMTLFKESSEASVFDNFIATDAPGDFNLAVRNMIENDEFPQNKLNKKLHYSFSTSNDHFNSTELIKKINDAQYSWLQFKSIEFTNSGYENSYPAAFDAGIKFIFEK